MNKIIQYTTDTKFYYQNSSIPSICNSITFLNLGTNPVNVDGIPLQQSQSISFTGNENEINIKTYDISFSGAGTNQLAVIRKIYTGATEDFYYAQGRRLKTDVNKDC